MADSDDNYNGVLLENMNSNLKGVLEAVTRMEERMGALATKDDLKAVADDVVTIKAAVTATNADLASHDGRIAQLEAAA